VTGLRIDKVIFDDLPVVVVAEMEARASQPGQHSPSLIRRSRLFAQAEFYQPERRSAAAGKSA
jgi:hypothetical protein